MYELRVTATFDSAHHLVDSGTKCDNLHGHTWKVMVCLRSTKLQREGWVVNFSTVKQQLNGILDDFDHHVVNDVVHIPTAENIARHLYNRMTQGIGQHCRDVCVAWVEVYETPGCGVRYYEQ